MNLLDDTVRRAEYQLKTIEEVCGIDKLSEMSYIRALVMYTVPDLLLEIKHLKLEIERLKKE